VNEPQTPLLRVVKGEPTAAELAALTALRPSLAGLLALDGRPPTRLLVG
jgi:hypothetical protein